MKKIDKFLKEKAQWAELRPTLGALIHEEYVDGEETGDGVGFTRRIKAEVQSTIGDGEVNIVLNRSYQTDGEPEQGCNSFTLSTDAIRALAEFVDSLEDEDDDRPGLSMITL